MGWRMVKVDPDFLPGLTVTLAWEIEGGHDDD